MGDVLFDFGKYDLRQEAREKLAKLSGIILAHPGLKLAEFGSRRLLGRQRAAELGLSARSLEEHDQLASG